MTQSSLVTAKPEEPEESGSPQTSLNGEGSVTLEESNNPQTSLKEEDSIALEELHKTQSDLDA